MVVPWMSGDFSTSDLIPRDPAPGARTGCPWDAAGLVAFPNPTGDDVTLNTNTDYVLNTTVTIPGTLTVPAGSSLVFADKTFNLTARSIQVDGALRIGSSTCRTSPATKHTITLTGARTDADNITTGHKGIVVSGTDAIIEIFGHLHQPSWTRLAATASASATELYLQECVDWPVNSKLVVTTTHRVDWRRHNQNEEVTVAAVSCETIDYLEDGVSSYNFGKITLSQPLAYSHYAARKEYQAEVGLLSRNVLIQGSAEDSPPTDPQPAGTTCTSTKFTEVPCNGYYLTGYGGHLIVMENATARITATEFYRMGQTNQIGRYPVHLHLLGEHGNRSFVSDCSVHESYFRGFVVHGTFDTKVTRNVAYDVIAHVFYMESGIEERNEISFNLGAHVHAIGHFLDLNGQASDAVFYADDLGGAVIPADGAASPFYISNMYNNFTGNAAVGGFSGYAMVSFPAVIGEWPAGIPRDPSFVPMDRPGLEDGFYGNSARSMGWFWNLAPAFYVGGFLEMDTARDELMYRPARHLPGTRKPVLANGDDAWYHFINCKAVLSNVAGGDWNKRSKWYNMDIVDLGERSFNAFGNVAFRNINVRCRTANGANLNPAPPQSKNTEKIWEKHMFKLFRAYDTGQRHVVDSWQISGCGTAAQPMDTIFQRAQLWSVPHGVNVNQNQLAMRNITYLDGTPDPTKLISVDIGKKDTYSAYYGTFLDADGTVTQRNTHPARRSSGACKPAIVGSAGMRRAVNAGDGWDERPPNMWYKLSGLDDGGARGRNESDDRCELLDEAEYPMWACDEGSMNVGALLIQPNDRAQTTASTYEVWGRITHFGDAWEDGSPVSGDHQVVGPHDHAHRGGWALQFHTNADDPSSWSSPKKLLITEVGIREGSTLLLALAYPASTTFVITTEVAPSGFETLAAAASLAALRQDTTGLLYFFDGTYLYLRPFRKDNVDPNGFGEGNLFIPDKNTGNDDFIITATWDAATGCGTDDWCRAATLAVPPANAGEVAGRSTVWPCTTAVPLWYVRSSYPTASAPASSSMSWGTDPRFTIAACNETRTWEDLGSLMDAGDVVTGGLGLLMTVDAEEVWLCFKQHPCAAAAGLTPQGMCYVYHEGEARFIPWGLPDELQLIQYLW
eukprot:CAMPEP_0181328488 /NCGR_PEP_ID=MMETSP1101-20121128/22749_1 /TAXON_ID=46948 /ORGANISM="Rhodomonas abbreviata, Strain Caron Lab Isolate" /LENGTH=1128 /DNA_ID=CAMNT_0023437393 /DNA_START=399 /DNA_END=3785 /DNA_ORIENTATION=-